MASARPILEFDGVSVSYFPQSGEVPAIVDLSLSIAEGEAVAVVGESGCGKSTLVNAALNYFPASSRLLKGCVRFDGRNLSQLPPKQLGRIRGGGMGLIYQDAQSALNPSLIISEQLAEVVVKHKNLPWREARRRALEMISEVQLPDAERIAASYPHQLSGGQQQRVVIAMALIARPQVLLLDEPTTALDVTIEAGIIDLIGKLRKRYGMSLLFISHNLALVSQVCERIVVMYAGEIIEQGPTATVFHNPRHPYTRGLMKCIPSPFVEASRQNLESIPGQLDYAQIERPGCSFALRCRLFEPRVCRGSDIPMRLSAEGHGVRCSRADIEEPANSRPSEPRSRRGAGVLIDVNSLEKTYQIDDRSLIGVMLRRKKRAVYANRGVSLQAHEGEALAIVGESGSGKSTFAKILTGLETAEAGELRLSSLDVGRLPAKRRGLDLLRSMQMVFQDPDGTLNPNYSIGRQVLRAVRKLARPIGRAEARRQTAQLLHDVQLSPALATRRPRQLSGGQKQRAAIARALAGSPKVIVADEPVSALDVSVRAAITELLLRLQGMKGTTLLLVSHDLGLVRYVADRVVVMYLGQVVESGSVADIFNPPFHPYTEALLSAIPTVAPDARRNRVFLSGEMPSPSTAIKGCAFQSRCPHKLGRQCEEQRPPVHQSSTGHRIACHIPAARLMELQADRHLNSEAKKIV